MSRTIDEVLESKAVMEDRIRAAIQDFDDENKLYRFKVDVKIVYKSTSHMYGNWESRDVIVSVYINE